jgi:hypothetical protein
MSPTSLAFSIFFFFLLFLFPFGMEGPLGSSPYVQQVETTQVGTKIQKL